MEDPAREAAARWGHAQAVTPGRGCSRHNSRDLGPPALAKGHSCTEDLASQLEVFSQSQTWLPIAIFKFVLGRAPARDLPCMQLFT